MRNLTLVALTLASAFPAAAPTAAAPEAPAAASESEKKEKLICRREVQIGSLVNGRKVCMTREEWARVGDAGRDNAQQLIDDNTGRPPGGP